MSRRRSLQLLELEKLTRAREQAALAALSNVVSRKRLVEQKVDGLKRKHFQATTAMEAGLVSKWLTWQKAELARLNTELANLEAEYRQAVRDCGRQIAEQAVMSEIVDNARRDEAAKAERRQAFTSPDGQCP